MLTTATHPERRVDLDWLRVIAVLIVLFYHVAMMFVPWSFHVKSPEQSEVLVVVLRWLHSWRMPLLLFVSGAGSFLALRRRSPLAFLGERHRRLFIPIVLGFFVIVPPQIYMERIAQYGSFWEFYPTVFEFVPYPEGGSFSWHHLWFVVYLLTYSVWLLPLLLWLRSPRADALFDRLARFAEHRFATLAWLVPLVGCHLLLAPRWPEETHALVDDYAYLARYGLYFLAGFLFVRDPRLWEAVRRERHRNLGVALLAIPAAFAIGWETGYGVMGLVVGWPTLLAVAGWGQVYLTRGGPVLRYATEAIYPFYILHQTVLIVLGFYVIRWRHGLWSNLLLITFGSFVVIMAIYHVLVRPFAVTRVLFGMKPAPRARERIGPAPAPVGEVAS